MCRIATLAAGYSRSRHPAGKRVSIRGGVTGGGAVSKNGAEALIEFDASDDLLASRSSRQANSRAVIARLAGTS
jgi:hypothetical protein